MTLGKEFKKARLQKGLSVKELSHLTNLSEASIRGFENNDKLPHGSSFLKLQKALELDFDEYYEKLERERMERKEQKKNGVK